MAEAGWYPDPHNPRQQRYWNGSTWTEHTHVPEFTQPPNLPPFAPPPPSGRPLTAAGPSNPVNDIGEWLRSSFAVAWRKLGVCFVLGLLGFLPLLAIGALVLLALYDLEIVGDQVRGFGGTDVVLLLAAGLVALGSLVWFGVVTIAQYRVLHDAHRERSIGVGDALAVGRRNIGRLIVAYLILYAIGFMILALIVGVAAAVTVGAGSSSSPEELIDRALPIYNLVSVLTWPISLWLTVKLAFIPVAAAVAPRDNGLLRTSMRASDGRFWAVLGRMLLLQLVATAVFIPVMIVGVIVIALGALTVGSAGAGAGGIGVAVILGVVFGLLFVGALFFVQMAQASALSRLYADLGGPIAE